MLRLAVVGVLLSLATPAVSATSPNPTKALLWSLLPGGGHYYLGEHGTGTAYAVSSGLLMLAGAGIAARNDDLGGREDEYIAPAILGQKLWELSFFTTWRSALAQGGTDLRAAGYDDTPIPELLLAPFHPDQWLDPWVVGAGLVAGAVSVLAADRDRQGYGDISRVGLWGRDWNRNDGTGMYLASAHMVSAGAGVAEEAVFRGLLQTMFQDQWGRGPGLLVASGIFGLAHVVGPDGQANPAAVANAAAAGLYLGWLYNNNGNRLAKPIAAHYWFNFALMAGSWFADPEENALGVDVQFRF